jgi:hypothetical protein
MTTESSSTSDSSQFRRQLAATVAGALIAMSTTTGVALFQWATQSKEQRHREQVEALSQLASEVSRALGTQAIDWHIANKSAHIAARARRLAAMPDLSKPEGLGEYKELLKAAWDLETEITAESREAAQRRGATAAAYYKLMVAFDDIQPFAMTVLSEQNITWGIMSESPRAPELLSMAALFETWSARFRADADNVGKSHNAWNEQITKLATKARQ